MFQLLKELEKKQAPLLSSLTNKMVATEGKGVSVFPDTYNLDKMRLTHYKKARKINDAYNSVEPCH